MRSATHDLPAQGQRLALLGAFPFPYPQGSQIFARDQARALAACGARPEFFSYGRGAGRPFEDLQRHSTARWLSPRRMGSGPQWGKPLADLALARLWQRAAARAQDRGDPYECLLAHNAEAAWIGIALRSITKVPVVYVAHTILRHELSAYLPVSLAGPANSIGGFIDRRIAGRSDGIIALGKEAAVGLETDSSVPIRVLPPGHFERPAPTPREVIRTCERYGLKPGEYALYSGNLDRYQDLDLLEQAVRQRPNPSLPPIALACHDPRAAAHWSASRHNLVRCIGVPCFEHMQALIHGAQSLLLTRQRPGGFPVKLLNYMEAARPIVAFENIAIGLVDGESARLLPVGSTASDVGRALVELRCQPELRRRLGDGALRTLRREHDWSRIGPRTLEYLDEILPNRRLEVPG